MSAERGREPAIPDRRGEQGHALLVALLVLVLLTSALVLAGAAYQRRATEVRNESVRLHLVALADAGLAETIAELSLNPAYPGLVPTIVERGEVTSECGPAGENRTWILVEARYAGRKRAIEAEVRHTVLGAILTSWRRVDSD